MDVKKYSILLIVLLIVSAGVAYGVLTGQIIITSTGIIFCPPPPPPPQTIGVEVYADSALTTKIINLDWGVMNPGSVNSRVIFLKNTGNTDGVVTMAARNWSPPVTVNITRLTWDHEGAGLGAGENWQANITLEVFGSVYDTTSFSLEIIFTIRGS